MLFKIILFLVLQLHEQSLAQCNSANFYCDICSFCAELQSSGSTRCPHCSSEAGKLIDLIIRALIDLKIYSLFNFFLKGRNFICFIVAKCILMTGKHLNTAGFADSCGGGDVSGILNDSSTGAGPLLSPYPFPIPGIIHPSHCGNVRNPQCVAQLV